ncbi:NADP-dependent oxidoreductase [Agrococcus jejuensis]|uniref:NADPH:quinone reductase n=1 Tax=Agrococcus jejuensis TaxID=399736 RepID=A0A1G8D479_9MICO|nr:NADP-dependent oxidoreductase [Agrococcus jejuensis]SDH52608.1 NADPH:quinone reductase [Agrococcus jejuensis]
MSDAAERASTSRRVVHHRFGGPDVLEIEVVPVPVPTHDEVLVRIEAAGVNPVDWKIFGGGPMFEPYDRHLPSGTGYDFAGTIVEVGADVDQAWRVGDRVLGGLRFHAMADHLVTAPGGLVRVPDGLEVIVAGALNVVGRTAFAAVRAVDVAPGDTVLVSGAAGGVGVLAAQLARRTGARVLGTASPRNHRLLRRLGIEPIAYGDGLVERVRAAAPEGATAAVDAVGHGTVAAALALGVARHRIDTVADPPAVAAHGVLGVGGAAAGAVELAQVAALLAAGELELPIDSVHALGDVQAAYRRSMTGHAVGKIVVDPTLDSPLR